MSEDKYFKFTNNINNAKIDFHNVLITDLQKLTINAIEKEGLESIEWNYLNNDSYFECTLLFDTQNSYDRMVWFDSDEDFDHECFSILKNKAFCQKLCYLLTEMIMDSDDDDHSIFGRYFADKTGFYEGYDGSPSDGWYLIKKYEEEPEDLNSVMASIIKNLRFISIPAAALLSNSTIKEIDYQNKKISFYFDNNGFVELLIKSKYKRINQAICNHFNQYDWECVLESPQTFLRKQLNDIFKK